MKIYIPKYELTKNYTEGMKCIHDRKIGEAITIFSNEPVGSSCYVMALGNLALCYLRQDKYLECEEYSLKVFEEVEENGIPHPASYVQFCRNYCESLMKQGRLGESLKKYNNTIHIGKDLIEQSPTDMKSIEIEMAHAYTSWGSALLIIGNYKTAIELYEKSVSIYEKYHDLNTVGLPEVYTNLASAYVKDENFYKAELCLLQALKVAEDDNCDKEDQIFRIKSKMFEIGSKEINENPLEFFDRASEYALKDERYDTALTRISIGIQYHLNLQDAENSRLLLNKGKLIEKKIKFFTENSVNFKISEAGVLLLEKKPKPEIVEVLRRGASEWYQILTRKMISSDFGIQTSKMKTLFDLLSIELINAGKLDQACMAMEYGRGLSYSIEHKDSTFFQVITQNPFKNSEVEISLLTKLQSSLTEDEVILSMHYVVNRFNTFIISKDKVDVLVFDIEEKRAISLFQEIESIPEKLKLGKEIAAFPKEIFGISKSIITECSSKKIKVIFPYSTLHKIPWSTVFELVTNDNKYSSIPIGFGIIPYSMFEKNVISGSINAVSLGNGIVESTGLDLNEEAEHFSNSISGVFVKNFDRCDLQKAFSKNNLIHISCHGSVNSQKGTKLILEMRDGNYSIDEFLPKKINCSLVILSACSSGVYELVYSEHPIGAAPLLLAKGANYVIGTRYPVNAYYAKEFIKILAQNLKTNSDIVIAFENTKKYFLDKKEYSSLFNRCCFELFA